VTHLSTHSVPRYITTALPYVNARPHLGFALEAVIADTLARHARREGRPVRFVSGTDEHSLKNVLAAERAGIPTADLVAAHARAFQALGGTLDLSLDDFVRTSADPRHRAAVEWVWAACARRGDFYRKAYRGLYCIGCEQFFEPGDLADGACPEHGTAPVVVEEENWFFRLSRYREPLLDAIAEGRLRIEPAGAREQTLAFLRGPVHDISVSRSSERARGFGIPVPGDASQVVYVWLDALVGYLAALGFPGDDALTARFWGGPSERVHVIGKGINRFHTVLWPALLASAGLPLPTHVLVHGYLTIDGRKISKTGPSVDPVPLVAEYGADALRYYLLRHVRTTKDGDFRIERFVEAHDAELANQLGNLVRRALALVERHAGGRAPTPAALEDADASLVAEVKSLSGRVDEAVGRFALDEALVAIFTVVDAANRYVEQTAPWSLANEARGGRIGTVLYCLVETIAALAEELAPFLPGTAQAIRARFDPEAPPVRRAGRWGLLAPGTAVERGPALFPRRARRP
jgi:methionyl-tRNA synthetase